MASGRRAGRWREARFFRNKLKHAYTLLGTSKKSIRDIMLALGYSDDKVFRRLFHKRIKMTPSAYRQRLSS